MKTLDVKRRSAGAVAAFAFRGLFLGVGAVIFACLSEMIDSFVDGVADILFNDET